MMATAEGATAWVTLMALALIDLKTLRNLI